MPQTTHPAPAPTPVPYAQVFEVRAEVARIAEMTGDPEAAHGAEDELWRGVLEAIATGNAQAGYLAAEALKTRDLDFPRYCS